MRKTFVTLSSGKTLLWRSPPKLGGMQTGMASGGERAGSPTALLLLASWGECALQARTSPNKAPKFYPQTTNPKHPVQVLTSYWERPRTNRFQILRMCQSVIILNAFDCLCFVTKHHPYLMAVSFWNMNKCHVQNQFFRKAPSVGN